MDDSSEENAQSRRIHPKLKYMRQLQNIADRTASQIVIELDDIAAVSYTLSVACVFHY
jgi:hypothetical protein